MSEDKNKGNKVKQNVNNKLSPYIRILYSYISIYIL